MTVTLLLDTTQKINQFLGFVSNLPYGIFLKTSSGAAIRDISLMGILSSDYRKPLYLEIWASVDEASELLQNLRPLMI